MVGPAAISEAAGLSRRLWIASFSSSTSFDLIESWITRLLRSTLMILASTSSPSFRTLRASSMRSRLISEAFRVASISLARVMMAPLASTSFTTPLTIAPLSFSWTYSENGSLSSCLIHVSYTHMTLPTNREA